MAGSKRSFGQISKLPSGRYRARYTGPDTRLYNAPVTFDAKVDAAQADDATEQLDHALGLEDRLSGVVGRRALLVGGPCRVRGAGALGAAAVAALVGSNILSDLQKV